MAKITTGDLIGDVSVLDFVRERLVRRAYPLDANHDERRCKRCRCFLRPTNGEQHCDPCMVVLKTRKGRYAERMPSQCNPNYELMPLWYSAFKRKPNLFLKYYSSFLPRTRITETWRDRATAYSLLHIFGPGAIADCFKRERPATFDLTWGKLRDWLWPKSLEYSE